MRKSSNFETRKIRNDNHQAQGLAVGELATAHRQVFTIQQASITAEAFPQPHTAPMLRVSEFIGRLTHPSQPREITN